MTKRAGIRHRVRSLWVFEKASWRGTAEMTDLKCFGTGAA
jgi:hypothetical protein